MIEKIINTLLINENKNKNDNNVHGNLYPE